MIYNLSEDKVSEKVKKFLGVSNWMISDDSSDDYFCSCGHHGEGNVFDSDFECPICHNKLFYCVDIKHDKIPLKYCYKILRDDNIFIMKLSIFGVEIDNGNLSIDSEPVDIDDIYVVYLKKNNIFGLFKIYDFEIKDLLVCDDDDFFVILEDWMVENKQGLNFSFAEMRDLEYFSDYDVDYSFFSESLKLSGINDIAKELSRVTNIEVPEDIEYFEELFYFFFEKINFPLHESNYIKNFVSKQNTYNRLLRDYFDFIRRGINVKETDEEKAFGVKAELLSKISDFDMLDSIKRFYKVLEDNDIEEYEEHILEPLSILQKLDILELSERCPDVPIASIIRHVGIGIQRGEDFVTILRVDNEILDDEKWSHILDFNVPYSKRLYDKYFLLQNGVMSEDDYEKFVHSPTLNTLFNICK